MTEAPRDRPPEGALLVGVSLFYVPLALGAVLWIGWQHGTEVLLARTVGPAPLQGLLLGALVGLGIVGAVRAARPLGWTDGMERGLSRILGRPSWGMAFGLALASGVGEELFFRAALQPALGPIWATVIFAAVHVPLERDLWLWPLFALLAGAVFAALFAWTGAALAPAVAHFTVNLLNLRLLREGPPLSAAIGRPLRGPHRPRPGRRRPFHRPRGSSPRS